MALHETGNALKSKQQPGVCNLGGGGWHEHQGKAAVVCRIQRPARQPGSRTHSENSEGSQCGIDIWYAGAVRG
jgi:hypothetical protein